jgi:hypothetical protein
MEIPTHGENQGILSPPTIKFTSKILKAIIFKLGIQGSKRQLMKTRIMNEGTLGRKSPQFLLDLRIGFSFLGV